MEINQSQIHSFVDFRTDAASISPPQMLKAMSEAEVGDDVFDDDPTANKFQQKVAKYFGFEAAMIVPSTTMSNLISVLLCTKPGDEVIVWGRSHILQKQNAGIAMIGGVQTRQVLSQTGIITTQQIKKRLRKQSHNLHFPDTSLIIIQNPIQTGEVWPLESLEQIKNYAQKQNIKVMIDGRRIINAIAHYGCQPSSISKYCDLMTMCLTKGFSCPFGSLIFATSQHIKRAKQIRKSLGGGMRQIGIIGAAGLYALDYILPQIKNDNQLAIYIGSCLKKIAGIQIDCQKIQSNIVQFKINLQDFDNREYQQYMLSNEIKLKAKEYDNFYRILIHRQIKQEDCKKFIQLTKDYLMKVSEFNSDRQSKVKNKTEN